jgi:hypothetical protein
VGGEQKRRSHGRRTEAEFFKLAERVLALRTLVTSIRDLLGLGHGERRMLAVMHGVLSSALYFLSGKKGLGLP